MNALFRRQFITNLRRVFQAVHSARAAVGAKERTQVLLSKKGTQWITRDGRANIFKKSIIDRYIDRPNALFSGEK